MTHQYHARQASSSSRNTSSAFQMPSYTSHTSRGPSSPKKSNKQQHFGDPSASISPGKRARMGNHKSSHMDSDQSLLEMLSSTVACLKQKNMDLEALGCLEQSLWLKRRMFGIDNSVVQRALHEVVLSYNSVAMQYLAQAQFDQCLSMLRKAEAITAPGNFKKCQSLQILTFNNIGCCYRKLGKLKSALKYLKEAAQIGSTCAHVKNLSITHLNLCAIQSQLGRHDLALEHAQAAIFHTQEELVSMEAKGSDEGRDEEEDYTSSGPPDVLDAKSREEKIISLAVAYHNLAVELEFNGRGEASLQWYKKALQLVWKYRESNGALCDSFKKIFMDAKKKQEMQRSSNGSARMNTPSSSRANPANGDRRSIARPKSAHSSSSSRAAGSEAASCADVSYSATVASQCYKPIKHSQTGLNDASPPNGARCNRSATKSRGTPTPSSSKAQRTSSSASAYRQRPLSASTTRSAPIKDSERDSSAPNIDAHWKRLEQEYSMENPAFSHSAASKTRAAQSSRASQRPQSAHATSSRAVQRSRSEQDDDSFLFANCPHDGEVSGDDEDCGVLEDDDPSEDEADGLESDDFADLLLRREEKQSQQKNQRKSQPHAETKPDTENSMSGRGHRHRQALDEARRKRSFGTEQALCGGDSHGARIDGGEASSSGGSSVLGDDESDLPNQRVSHMEYLRRMKRLAENIKDDLAGNPAPPATAKPSSAQPTQRGIPLKPLSAATPSKQVSENQGSPALATPRGSTSKIRERLERVRSESFQSLPQCAEANEPDSLAVDLSSTAKTKSNTPPDHAAHVDEESFIEVVEDANVYATEHAVGVGERALIHAAAAKHIQAFVRGEKVRDRVRKERQVSFGTMANRRSLAKVIFLTSSGHFCAMPLTPFYDVCVEPQQILENKAALQIQGCAKQFVQHSREQRGEREESMLLAHEQEEVEDMAASLIQQAYRRRFHESRYLSQPELQDGRQSDSIGSTDRPQTPRRQSDTSMRGDGEVTAGAPDGHRLDSAATRIQATMKGFYTREVVTEHHAAHLSRMYVERKHMEVALHHTVALEQAFLEEVSATKIQALVRGRQSRIIFEATKIGLNAAAERIQSVFRSHRRCVVKSTDVGVRSVAARSIQQMFRRYLQRQNRGHEATINEELSEVQHIAAMSLQRFWRLVAARRETLLEELEAATCIQALGRGHLARKSFQSLRESTSQIGLSKSSSAFSISAANDVLEEDPNVDGGDRDEKLDRSAVNMSFLPAAVRALYSSFVNSPSYPEARAAQKTEYDMEEMQEMGLSFEDLMLEFETCGDLSTACFALSAMRMLVLMEPEQHCTLPIVIKVARVIDQRMHEPAIWTSDVQQGCLWFIDAFQEMLLRT